MRRGTFLRLFAVLAFAVLLLRVQERAPAPAAAVAAAAPQAALVREETVATDAATDAAGNGWGSHKLRLIRLDDGTVLTAYAVAGSDDLHKTWVLVRRTAAGWQQEASGPAGREPVNLLRGPGDQALVVSWPDQTPTLWDSVTQVAHPIPGNWQATDWPYAAAAISPAGDLYVLESLCSCAPDAPNTNSTYGWSYRAATSGQWQFRSFPSDYRYAYMFLFPTTSGAMNVVGTRDVLWSELGYRQPGGAFGYVFNAARSWQGAGSGPQAASTLVHEEVPTAQFPAVLTDATDVYVDTLGRTHVLYSVQGPSTGGLFQGRHAVLQNGVVLADVPNPVPYPNLSRIIQDTTGRFTIFSVCGSDVAVASGVPGDSEGTQLGPTVTLHFQQAYDCDRENNTFIAAPRGGTPLADYVDGAFDTGSQWIYYRLQLRPAAPASGNACTGATLSTEPTPTPASGGPLTLRATAVGCSTPQYRFVATNETGTAQVMQDYSPNATLVWRPNGHQRGPYQFLVEVKDEGAGDEQETRATLWYDPPPSCTASVGQEGSRAHHATCAPPGQS